MVTDGRNLINELESLVDRVIEITESCVEEEKKRCLNDSEVWPHASSLLNELFSFSILLRHAEPFRLSNHLNQMKKTELLNITNLQSAAVKGKVTRYRQFQGLFLQHLIPAR